MVVAINILVGIILGVLIGHTIKAITKKNKDE